ncbi:HET-domain-containing protein [Aspergillus transmontanensis]|uniref:HET-domain-containing protein n=1 Tax=Aspergillus transmontanensis TaxID=1034304 RepID=A0A5N6W3K3_9EURO|nr:HET-domain-containing protein [Aspergillus transmontanensis]
MPRSDPTRYLGWNTQTTHVCDRCWQNFFDTEAYEQCCTWTHSNYDYKEIGIETTATISQIKSTLCNWCAYVTSFISDAWMPEDRITTYFAPTLIPSCTPTGNNIFYLSISCHSPTGKWRGADDPASDYVTARPLRTDINSGAARMQIRTWLRECKGHRVIEVNPPGRQYARVLESNNLPFLTLNTSNYVQLAQYLDEETLPSTVRDAIAITHTLSIPYLWVDALCIIQDSEEDKAREITRMKDIYASSTLTIVAAAAESASKGFLYPRRLEPIAKRAWTMQEQLLSNRTLTFTTRTMMWTCHEGIKNFANSLYFPHDLDAGYNANDEKYSLNLHSLLLHPEEACADKEKSLSCWMRLVTAYSIRITSFERDKLNALAGIASHPSFTYALGPGYFAGLWQYNLARQLTWQTSSWHRTLAEDESFTFSRSVAYQAPSWSWASLNGGIIHFDFSFDEDEIIPEVICDILDCSTTPALPRLNPFGEILSARLMLRGPTRKAWFKPSTSNIFLLPGHTHAKTLAMTVEDEQITVEEALQIHLDNFRVKYPDVDLIEEPAATHGTNYRNICGKCDETAYCECYLVLCVAITLDRKVDDGVKGLLLIKDKAESHSSSNT